MLDWRCPIPSHQRASERELVIAGNRNIRATKGRGQLSGTGTRLRWKRESTIEDIKKLHIWSQQLLAPRDML